jgi:hypothetical protein
MDSNLQKLFDFLCTPKILDSCVIKWSCPVPYFGDISKSIVATVGINPSNREFMDKTGNELHGKSRRFHTLNSLGLSSWNELDQNHLNMIIKTYSNYFFGNPYELWFRRLNPIVNSAKASYYDNSCPACHIDLIPYATEDKWGNMTRIEQSLLINGICNTFCIYIRESPIKILILNGTSVVELFQEITNTKLEKRGMPSWTLPRKSSECVLGFAYYGLVNTLSNINLGRDVLILGFNHNIQSSFGVTKEVIKSIAFWIAQATDEIM